MLEQAGPLGFVILAVAGLGLLVALAMTGLGITKRRVPVSIWILLPIAVAALGGIGTYLGVSTAIDAVAEASADARTAMGMEGLANALGADYVGRWAAAALLALACWGAGLGAVVATGPEKRWTVGSTILGALFAIGGAVGIGVVAMLKDVGSEGYMIAGLIGFGGLGVAVGSARRALDEHAHRVAAMRFASGITLLFAASYAANAMKVAGRIGVYEAAASGSIDAIAAASANLDALSLLGWMAWGFAVIIALAGFISEFGDVVQKGTLFDVVVMLLLMGALFGVRQVEKGQVQNLQDVATLTPIHDVVVLREIGWPGAADLPMAAVMHERKEYVAKPQDVFFGDLLVWKKDQWVRTHKWTGGGWDLDGDTDGAPLAGLQLDTTRPILLVTGMSDDWKNVVSLMETYKDADFNILMRAPVFRACETDPLTGEIIEEGCDPDRGATVEMNKYTEPETIPLHVAMLPIALDEKPVDLANQLWLTAHNQQVFIGPVRYWGELASERRNLSARTHTALAAHGADGVHALLNERARIKDYTDTYMNVTYTVPDGAKAPTDITTSGKWINFTMGTEADFLAKAAEGFVQTQPENLTLLKVKINQGEHSEEDIQRLLSWELPALSTCASAFRDGDERGRLEATVHLSRKGRTSDWADTPKSKVESDDVWQCIMDRVDRVPFPEIEDKAGSDLEFHLNFS